MTAASCPAGTCPAARRLRPRPAHHPPHPPPPPGSRGCSGARRGAGPAGRAGLGASPAAPVSTWRMTSDQAPVLWPFIATPGLPPTGAQMGIDLLSGGSFYADPLGWVLRRRRPGHQPQRDLLRQTRPRQVRHHQGVLPADDGLRLPHPGPGRPQGRVRTAVPRPRRASRSRSAPACPPGSTRWRSGRSGQHWDQLDRGSRPTAAPRSSSPAGSPSSAAWSARQRVGAHPVPFGPVEESVVKAALRAPDRLRHRQHHPGRDHHPAAVAPARPTPPPSWSPQCRYADHRHFLDETRLLRDALGQLVDGALAGLFDDHTTIDVDWAAPIQSLSLSRLEAAGRRSRRHRPDLPELLGPRDARARRPRRPADRRARRGRGSRCASASRP